MPPKRSWILVAAIVAACQAAPAGTRAPMRASAVATATPQVHAPISPPTSIVPTTASVASPGRPRGKLLPTTDGMPVSGHVTIDAAYIISNHGGSLIANNGGNLLAAGQGLLSSDGRLVTRAGDAIAEADGNIISEHGGGIIANNGGGVVGNNGGGIIANNGGGVVSNNAGNLIGKAKMRLMAATVPPVGTVLPAAGIEISATSLDNGRPISIGKDTSGNPVYTIYTNLKGAYTIYLPPGGLANVLVKAQVPDATDPRQHYGLVAPVGAKAADLTEDTDGSTRQIRTFLAAQVRSFWTDPPAASMCNIANTTHLTAGVKSLLLAQLTKYHDAAVAAGLSGAAGQSPAAYALALRCADAVLGRLPLDTVMLSPDTGLGWGSNPGEVTEPAVQAMTECFATIRAAAGAKLAADPHFFESEADVVQANACAAGRYTIERPSDVTDFMIDEYLSNATDPGLYAADNVIIAIGAQNDVNGVGTRHKLLAVIDTLGLALFQALVGNAHGENDAVTSLMQAFNPAASPPPEGWPALPASPCPRPNYSPRGVVAACRDGGASATTTATAAASATAATGATSPTTAVTR